MKIWKCAFLAVVPVALTACGGYDCSSKDVHRSLLDVIAGKPEKATDSFGMINPAKELEDAMGFGTSEASRRAIAAGKVTEVSTLEEDGDTGAFACNATISVLSPQGSEVNVKMDYRIQKVDAGFEVVAQRSDIRRLRGIVNNPASAEIYRKIEDVVKGL